MGATSRFQCQACGYEADVSGGPDVGFVVRTRTVSCPACRTLSDVTTGPSGEGLPGTDDIDPLSLNRCGSCGATDLVPWDDGEPCPRCAGAMVNRGLVTLWD
jgi:hypothetical protein